MKRFVWLALVFAISCCSLARASEVDPKSIDQLFAKWDKTDTPGASLLVVQNGKVIYRRGYGMANIEAGVKNSPTTAFDVASVSKQFTAFAIYLLAQDGMLSLGDDVRKYVPELKFSETITIEQLLHHTSGIRDYYNLLTLVGVREDDQISANEVQRLLLLQRTLNFPPGTEQVYSNSGYFILALIVQRVSGMPLPDFAQQRIFTPLKMQRTRYVDSYGTLLKERALGYVPWKEEYRSFAASTAVVGPSGIFTTVEDLALWDANFYDARVGGAALLKAIQTPGALSNGKVTPYAGGLVVKTYRQLPIVEHAGRETAYRSETLRFPDQRLSIFILSNASNMNAPLTARRIADLYLADTPGFGPIAEVATAGRTEIQMKVPSEAAYLGNYQMRPGLVLAFTSENGKLMVQGTGQRKIEMFASGPNTFFAKAFEAAVTFDTSVQPVLSATWQQNDQALTLQRVSSVKPSAATMQACAGDFYSEELRTIYRVFVQDGKLTVGFWRADLPLTPVRDDLYIMPATEMWVDFHRGSNGMCDSAEVMTNRSRGMKFVRVQIPTAPAH